MHSRERDSLGELLQAIDRVLDAGETAVVATLLTGDVAIGAKVLIEKSGRTTGTLDNTDLSDGLVALAQRFLESQRDVTVFSLAEVSPNVTGSVLLERLQPEPRVVICGAGHVGASLARFGAVLGFHVTLIDDRPEFVTADKFSDERIKLCAAEGWANSVRKAIANGHGVSVAIVTRGHNQDEECLRAALTLNPDYVGMIGSKRRTNIVLQRLRDGGVEEQRINAVRAPIGLDIGAVTPEEVALSILAEIVAERRARRGGSLSSWRRHDPRDHTKQPEPST